MEHALCSDPWEALAAGAAALAAPLADVQVAEFRQYADLLIAANSQVNLTAVRDLPGIVAKLFLDSLSLIRPIADAAGLTCEALRTSTWKAADVGSGAGIPGIPLLIAWPALHMVFVESVAKKARFITSVAAALHLDAVVAQERAETLGRQQTHRECYDLVMARAVADLPVLAELTLPLVAVGGLAALPKGPRVHEEMAAANTAIKRLGGEVVGVETVDVPGVAETRTLIMLRKVQPTPSGFPRLPGVPAKKPIR